MTRFAQGEEHLRRLSKQCGDLCEMRSAAIPLVLRVVSRKQVTAVEDIPGLGKSEGQLLGLY